MNNRVVFRTVTILGVAFGCVIIGLFACTMYRAHLLWKGTTRSTTLAETSRLTTLKFPAGSRMLNSRFDQTWRSREIKIRMEMPRAKLREFIKTNALTDDVNGCPGAAMQSGDGYAWWDPQSCSRRKLTILRSQNPDAEAQSTIFIHLDDLREAEIYVYWFHD